MPRRNRPTLIETILDLCRNEPAFESVDVDRLKNDGEDYYDRELGLCGEFLVSRGTITRDQLGLALAKQAIAHGEFEKSMALSKKVRDEAFGQMSNAISMLRELHLEGERGPS